MIIVCITGASGVILGIRCVEELLNKNKLVSCVVSTSAWPIIHHELQINCNTVAEILKQRKISEDYYHNFKEYRADDLFAPIASGSNKFDAAVIIPASMKTAAAIAHGYADNLIHRVSDVALKEKRKLIVVPRETPLSSIHLANLHTIALHGVGVVMPIPAFYNFPQSVADVIDFIVGRVLDMLDIEHTLYRQWRDEDNNRSQNTCR